MKKSDEKIIKEENTEYIVSFCFGSEKIEDLIMAYLTEKVRKEIEEKTADKLSIYESKSLKLVTVPGIPFIITSCFSSSTISTFHFTTLCAVKLFKSNL